MQNNQGFRSLSLHPRLHRSPPPHHPKASSMGRRWKDCFGKLKRKLDIILLFLKLPIFHCNCFTHIIYISLHFKGENNGGRWRTCRLLSSWIKGSRTHLVGWSTAGPLALIAEIILPLMTPAYSEISLLKLVLADYLQVLELHLFAILQMW